MVKAPRRLAWAIVDQATNDWAILCGSLPVFWFRRVATEVALDRGYTLIGPSATARIVRVQIAQVELRSNNATKRLEDDIGLHLDR